MTPSYAEVARELLSKSWITHRNDLGRHDLREQAERDLTRALAAADRAGQERMRERGATVADASADSWRDRMPAHREQAEEIATAIRGLPIEEP